MSIYTLTSEDLDTVDESVGGATAKWEILNAGNKTPLLTNIVSELQEIADGSTIKTVDRPEDTFMFLLWDGVAPAVEIDVFPAGEPGHDQEIADRFSFLMIATWNLASWTMSDTNWLTMVEEQNLGVMMHMPSYISPRLGQIKNSGSPQNWSDRRLNYDTEGESYSLINGDVNDLLTKAVLMDAANVLANMSNITIFLYPTEKRQALLEGTVADAVAATQGIDTLVAWVTRTSSNTSAKVDDDDETYLSLKWHWERRSEVLSDRETTRIAKEAWPNAYYAGSDMYSPHAFDSNPDAWIVWTTGAKADGWATNCAVRVLRMQESVRVAGSNTTIVCGPQLASKGLTGIDRAVTPNTYSTMAWNSVIFGVRGLAGWGMVYVFQDGFAENGRRYLDNGEALWASIPAIKTAFSAVNDMLVSWEPATRRVALWWSDIDLMYESGRNEDEIGLPTPSASRGWISVHARDNVARAALMTGEPYDIVHDAAVDSGRINNYDVLICPCNYYMTETHKTRLNAFVAQGGTIMTHSDSIIVSEGITVTQFVGPFFDDGLAGNDPSSLAQYYAYYSDYMTAADYRTFLEVVAAELVAAYPFTPAFPRNGTRFIYNKMVGTDAKEYVCLVNDDNVSGAEAEWFEANSLGNRAGKYADEGNAITVTNPTELDLCDTMTGEVFLSHETIPIAAGWGRILQVLVVDDNSGTSDFGEELALALTNVGATDAVSIKRFRTLPRQHPEMQQVLDDMFEMTNRVVSRKRIRHDALKLLKEDNYPECV